MPQRSVGIVAQQRKMLTAGPEVTVDEAARLMKKHGRSAILVVDGSEHLAGIFTERDALYRVIAARKDPKTTKLGAVMTANPKTVAADKPFGFALFLMVEGGFRHVPVVEDGRPVGIVSARDALGPELHEFSEEMLNRDHIGEILG